MKNKILISRNYIFYDEKNKSDEFAILSTKLFNEFAILVDKPEFVNKNTVRAVATYYKRNIPSGFYDNPQDLKYYTCEELNIEKMVSYFTITLAGEHSDNKNVFKRVDIFDKALPKYKEGEEVKIRHYKMVNGAEADEIFKQLAKDLTKYTRPWSVGEVDEFKWLYKNGYYDGEELSCKDNAITCLMEFEKPEFAMILDKKDVVKLSCTLYGDTYSLVIPEELRKVFNLGISYAKDCPLSLKQAKYYNTIIKRCNYEFAERADNSKSPYKHAKNLMKQGKVLETAEYLKTQGSLFERNIVWLLSRASIDEIPKIIDLISDKNPIVLIQLIQKALLDTYTKPRVFKFFYNKKVKRHLETPDELKYRKSVLSVGIKNALEEALYKKLEAYYKNKPSLGKIYIAENFKKVAVPTNTSANGTGLGVIPTGSRVKIKGDNIRAFCYWKDAFDIDISMVLYKDNLEFAECVYWADYDIAEEQFKGSLLLSGDCRSSEGAEFFDVKIPELIKMGYKHAILCMNGYSCVLNEGEIYCGYQNKDNLDTKVWSPKNIEMRMQVKGTSKSYIGFAIDLENKEMVILNQVISGNNCVISESQSSCANEFLNPSYVTNMNMHKILSYLGEVVSSPEEADVVFDDDYEIEEDVDQNETSESKKTQKVIKSTDIEKLVGFII